MWPRGSVGCACLLLAPLVDLRVCMAQTAAAHPHSLRVARVPHLWRQPHHRLSRMLRMLQFAPWCARAAWMCLCVLFCGVQAQGAGAGLICAVAATHATELVQWMMRKHCY